jgi:hypothetical protein
MSESLTLKSKKKKKSHQLSIPQTTTSSEPDIFLGASHQKPKHPIQPKLMRYLTIRKLININKYINRNILSVNY